MARMIPLQPVHSPDSRLQQLVRDELTPTDRAFFVARGLQTWLYLVAVNWVYGPIQAFTSFWDPVTMVARFNFYELCPTINEVACIVGMSPQFPPVLAMRPRDGYSKLAKKYLGSSGINIFANPAGIHRDSFVSTCITSVPDVGWVGRDGVSQHVDVDGLRRRFPQQVGVPVREVDEVGAPGGVEVGPADVAAAPGLHDPLEEEEEGEGEEGEGEAEEDQRESHLHLLQ